MLGLPSYDLRLSTYYHPITLKRPWLRKRIKAIVSYCMHPKRVKTHTRSGFEFEPGRKKSLIKNFKCFSKVLALGKHLECFFFGRQDRYEKNLTKYLVETEDSVEYNQEYEECVESRLEVDVTSNVPFPDGPQRVMDTKASGRSEAESDGEDVEATSSSSEADEEPPKKAKRTKSPGGRDANPKRQKHLEDEPEDRVESYFTIGIHQNRFQNHLQHLTFLSWIIVL